MAREETDDRRGIVTKRSPGSVSDTVTRPTDLLGAKGMPSSIKPPKRAR
jgi:hypothetical protein